MLINLLNTLLVICCVFLILLVLIQRGKGGGLAGAFGGMGGSSAFGTKAGDVFTKVTMWVAAVWICISMVLVLLTNRERTSDWDKFGGPTPARRAKAVPGRTGSPVPGRGSSTSGAGTGAVDVEESAPSSGAPTKPAAPRQPANPGDPLAPLPPPGNK